MARELAGQGWRLVIDARTAKPLHQLAESLRDHATVTAISGDVTDPEHRLELMKAASSLGGLDLLMNNASTLGPTPLPQLADVGESDLAGVLNTNLLAPLALIQLALPLLTDSAAVLNVSSDAAVEGYPGWGSYGASKAALDLITAVLAAEHPDLHWYAFDPGDMRTAMHQAAYPGEDISDRPDPETVVPSLLMLLATRPASGRYRASDLVTSTPPASARPATTETHTETHTETFA